jgi:membrane protein YqaA with SNARE-associated domain
MCHSSTFIHELRLFEKYYLFRTSCAALVFTCNVQHILLLFKSEILVVVLVLLHYLKRFRYVSLTEKYGVEVLPKNLR